MLGLHRSTRNRLVALLCDVPYLTEELASKLSITPAYRNYLTLVEDKLSDLDPDVFLSPAILQCEWKKAMYEKRHLVTRVSVHGFHHKLCVNEHWHERGNDCICRFCRESAVNLLHVFECSILCFKSLSELDV